MALLPTKRTQLNEPQRKLLDELRTFQWRRCTGEFVDPADMETRHLFFALRMIWNHSAPPELSFEPYRRYNFDSFYTPEYMASAVKAFMTELSERNDLTLQQQDTIKLMIRRFMAWKDAQPKRMPWSI